MVRLRAILLARLDAATPWAFLLAAVVTSLALICITPPFQSADETTHLIRADMLTFGPAGFTSRDGPEPQTQGRLHVAIMDAAAAFEHVKFEHSQAARLADFEAAQDERLDARMGQASPGLAFNPVFYAPPALAVAIGRHYGWTVLDTLYLARAFNALASIGLMFAALRLAGRQGLFAYAILTLPMAMALIASVSQDGPLFGTAALGVAILSRAMSADRPLRRRESWGAAICFGLVAIAKPPFLLLLLLLACAPAAQRRHKWAAIAAMGAVAVGWTVWTSATGWATPPPPGSLAEPDAQVQWLLRHPADWARLLLHTLSVHSNYPEQFVGVLGWLDTPLPQRFYPAAEIVVGLGALGAVAFGGKGWRMTRIAAAPVALATAAAVFFALYVAWTDVDAATIEGVQGRYLYPPVLALGLLLAGPRNVLEDNPVSGWALVATKAAVLLFPVVSFVVLLRTLIWRYYLS